MDDDALIDAAAAEAAPGYAALDVAPWAGLILYPYEPLGATVWGMPDVGPVYGIDRDTMDELGMPEDPESAAWLELEARVGADAWELAEPYYLALASRLRVLTGLPVLVYEADMPYEEQPARQTSAPAAADPLDGLDVIVSLRVDERRVAVVYRDADDQVWASGRYGFDDPEPGVGAFVDLGANPAVVAGKLPMGAVGVAVRVAAAPGSSRARSPRGIGSCVTPTNAPTRPAPDDRALSTASDTAHDRPWRQQAGRHGPRVDSP